MSGSHRRAADLPADPGGAEALDTPEARARREALIARIVAAGDLSDPRVIEAMQRVPRHLFMDELRGEVAYGDHPVPIGWSQTISQPTVVGMMTQALDLHGVERVLEIGTGSGYQTAILSLCAREVLTVERIAELGRRAASLLGRLGSANVRFRIGDGHAGWPEEAPFDRVLVTAAPTAIPEALVAQLAEGGVLVSPVGDAGGFSQSLYRGKKIEGAMQWSDLGRVSFVPMIAGEGEPWS